MKNAHTAIKQRKKNGAGLPSARSSDTLKA
jgi:hypothetical protein